MAAPKALKEKLAQEQAPAAPFRVDDIVEAADRANFGRVTGVDGDRITVRFTSQETGASVVKSFPPGMLKLAKPKPDETAPSFMVKGEMPEQKKPDYLPHLSSQGCNHGGVAT